MKRTWWLALTFVLAVAAPLFASDIQVLCEPGLRIYLDGEFQGVSAAKEDGLVLMNVANGPHRVWVEKDGFLSQSFAVEIHDAPIEVKVGEFTPVPLTRPDQAPAAAQVTELGGTLVITSAPQNCVVEVDGKPQTKDSPQLSIGGLTAGDHTISFTKPGDSPIVGVVKVEPGTSITVRGNLKDGKVEVVHEGKGSLRVYSTPTHCSLRFMGKLIEKTDLVQNMSYIPAGEQTLTASWGGRQLSTTVLIKKGQRAVVTLSFMDKDQPFVVTYEPE
jgi:hypothetical protein